MFGMRIENESLIYDDNIKKPSILKNEVLIKVEYAGVNRADLFQTKGSYPAPEGASKLPGLEVSGTICEIGEEVTSFKINDKVCALLEGGGYAQYAKVAASQVIPIPNGINLREAGALPEALFTVWLALFKTAKIKAGETVVIHGGASGIGSMASQLVHANGATAITTSSSLEKCKFSEKYGAGKSYIYKNCDFVENIKKDYGGADVILDIVGGDYFQKNLKLLKRNGRMVSLSFLRGAKADLNMASLLLKQLSWYGLTLRSRSVEEKAELTNQIKAECLQLIENNKISVPIDSEFAMQDANKALEKIEQNLNFGKILLKA